MAQRIRRFEPFQTAKILSVLYALMGLILAPIFVAVSLASPETAAFGIGFAVAIPVVYGIIGFITTLIGAACYNLVAGWVGGIELELE
ncbi:MAG: hypothetical protein WD771_00210 [Gemmatimonadaceae bacterium]